MKLEWERHSKLASRKMKIKYLKTKQPPPKKKEEEKSKTKQQTKNRCMRKENDIE